MAANATVPYTLANGAPQDASQVMANLIALRDWLNVNCLQIDGSKAMTGELSGPASDPTTNNQYTRKSYADTIAGQGTRYGCLVASGAGSIGASTTASVTWASETFDTHAFASLPATTVTVPTTGIYAVWSLVTQGTNGKLSLCRVQVNGADAIPMNFRTYIVGPFSYIDLWGLRVLLLNAGETVSLAITTNSNGAFAWSEATLTLARLSL